MKKKRPNAAGTYIIKIVFSFFTNWNFRVCHKRKATSNYSQSNRNVCKNRKMILFFPLLSVICIYDIASPAGAFIWWKKKKLTLHESRLNVFKDDKDEFLVTLIDGRVWPLSIIVYIYLVGSASLLQICEKSENDFGDHYIIYTVHPSTAAAELERKEKIYDVSLTEQVVANTKSAVSLRIHLLVLRQNLNHCVPEKLI